jgi:hypothetical protein
MWDIKDTQRCNGLHPSFENGQFFQGEYIRVAMAIAETKSETQDGT